MSAETLQAMYDTNTPERLKRARREIRRYSPEARAELDAETQWILDRHPEGLTHEAAAYCAWVRLRSGMHRDQRADRETQT